MATVTADERAVLGRFVRCGKVARRTALRAGIVLACGPGPATEPWRPTCGRRPRRSASGGGGSSTTGWTACSPSPGTTRRGP